jgi:phytoene dehydrogenase-like protein
VSTAVVVGGGPNGLAAAAVLAAEGVAVTLIEAADEVGGGTRSWEGIVPGLLHDHCSAIHPMAVGSPLFTHLDLGSYGLEWRLADIDCAHVLDGGVAAVLRTDVTATAASLGTDGATWRRLFAGPAARYDMLATDILRPLVGVPRHPLLLGRFGAPALAPATWLAGLFRTPAARALWVGVAAHAFTPLHRPFSAAIGLGIITAGHRYGWAVAAGGSRSISRALAAHLVAHGGRIETGVAVRTASDLPPSDVTLFDLDPAQVATILGDRLPSRIARRYRTFRRGPGAYKVDFAVSEGVPWTAAEARLASTVHVGGGPDEVVTAEREVARGRMPSRPFVLVGQQYLADPTRSAGSVHPVWTYAHVPHGYDGDATDAVIGQIERFAPGFRDRVVGMRVTRPADFAAWNPNFVGGDILTGAKDARQLLFGPTPAWNPYSTGIPGVYLCSAATPPGPGAHGMCGANAARQALAHLRRTAARDRGRRR